MNTKQILISVTLVAMAFLTSCKQDELIYSCDPVVDAWTKANIDEIRAMSRTDFLNLSMAHQRAAFNVYTPQQRINLWKEKLEETLLLEWTASERIHIETLLNMVVNNDEWFSNDRSEEVMDQIAIEIYRWTEYAREELGWDRKLGYALLGTPQIMNAHKEVNSSLPLPSFSKQEGSGNRGKCECSTSSNWCSDTGCLYVASCDASSLGCGTMWLYSCDGLCIDAITGATILVCPICGQSCHGTDCPNPTCEICNPVK